MIEHMHKIVSLGRSNLSCFEVFRHFSKDVMQGTDTKHSPYASPWFSGVTAVLISVSIINAAQSDSSRDSPSPNGYSDSDAATSIVNASLILILAILLGVQTRLRIKTHESKFDTIDALFSTCVVLADTAFSLFTIYTEINHLTQSNDHAFENTTNLTQSNSRSDQNEFDEDLFLMVTTMISLVSFSCKCILLSSQNLVDRYKVNHNSEIEHINTDQTLQGIYFNLFQNLMGGIGDILLFVVLFQPNRSLAHLANGLFLFMSLVSLTVTLGAK